MIDAAATTARFNLALQYSRIERDRPRLRHRLKNPNSPFCESSVSPLMGVLHRHKVIQRAPNIAIPLPSGGLGRSLTACLYSDHDAV